MFAPSDGKLAESDVDIYCRMNELIKKLEGDDLPAKLVNVKYGFEILSAKYDEKPDEKKYILAIRHVLLGEDTKAKTLLGRDAAFWKAFAKLE